MRPLYAYFGRSAIDYLVGEYGRRLGGVASDTRMVWVAPSSSSAGELRHRLVEKCGAGAVLDPGVFTSQQLASRIIAHSGEGPADRRIDPAGARWLLGGLIDQLQAAGRLELYDRLRSRSALVDLLLSEVDHAAARGQKPERLIALAKRSGDARQKEFADLFAEYQRAKASAGVMDRVDRWRMAADLLKCGKAGRWRLAVVAPWEAAASVEEEFFAALLAASDEAAVVIDDFASGTNGAERSLPGGGRLEKLFDKIEWRQSDEDPASINPLAVEPAARDLEFVRRWLFADPRETPAPPNLSESNRLAPNNCASKDAAQGGVRVMVGRGVQQEIDWVAADVKRRMLGGLRADDVLIAAPSVRSLGRRIREAFDRVGAPLFIDAPTRLGEAPLIRTLTSLLALPTGSWRHEDVLRVVTSPALQVFDRVADKTLPSNAEVKAAGLAGPRAAAELALRQLLLPSGRDELVDQLEREGAFLSRRIGEDQDPTRGDRRRLVACRAAISAVGRLVAALNQLPELATPIAWFDALRRLLDCLGYSASSAEVSTEASAGQAGWGEIDLAALETLEEAFVAVERLERSHGNGAGRFDINAVTRLLADWSPRLTIDAGVTEEGCVRLVSIEQAVQERPRVLYVPGLAEGTLPRPLPGGDPFAESSAAAAAHSSRERRRFRDLVASPTELVVLSFPGIDDKGQPLNPSSFVAEVERLLLPRSVRFDAEIDSASPLSCLDQRRAAIRGLVEGRDDELKRMAASAKGANAHAVLDGVAATLERSVGEAFGSFEGILSSPAAREEFANRYGPEHLWSPSQLERYAECPYKFFLRYVLGAEPLDPLAIDLDYRRRGSLLHDAMVRFHQAMPDAASPALGENEFLAQFESAIRSASESVPVAPHERPVARVEAMQAIAWGPQYREQVQAYAGDTKRFEEPMKPAYFEARFGPSRGGEATDATLSTDQPFRLPLGEEELLLAGRIDRIDVGVVDGRPVFNVIDYKTKKGMKATVDEVRSGVQLQLYLYALAAERLLLRERDAAPWRIGYWAVRDKGFLAPKENRESLAAGELIDGRLRPTDAWQALGGEVVDRLQTIVAGIRAGHFPPVYASDEAATNCEYRGVARVLETRHSEKTPPMLDATRVVDQTTGGDA